MIDVNRLENYTYDTLQVIANDEHLLAEETVKTDGLILYVLLHMNIKPSYEFFCKYVSEYSLLFFRKFYPEMSWEDISALPNYKDYEILDDTNFHTIKDSFAIELASHDFSYYEKNTTELARIFIKYYGFEKDYSRKFMGLMEVLQTKFTASQIESLLSFDFFDTVFLQQVDESFLYGFKLTQPENLALPFCLQKYLIHIATTNKHKDNPVFRRLYFNMVLAMVSRQEFSKEPKFYHRVVPNLFQTSTLSRVLDEVSVFLEASNPVFVEGLVKRCSSVNLAVALIFYLKSSNGLKNGYENKNKYSKILLQCLDKLSPDDAKKVLHLTNYIVKREVSSSKADDEASCESSYDLFTNPSLFLDKLSATAIKKLNYEAILQISSGFPNSWDSSQVGAFVSLASEKKFNTLVLEFINKSQKLSDFSVGLTSFIFSRNTLLSAVIKKYDRELEQLIFQAINKEKFDYFVLKGWKNKLPELMQKGFIDFELFNQVKRRFLLNDLSTPAIHHIADNFLAVKNYEDFFFFVSLLKKEISQEGKVVNSWKTHLKELCPTDLLLNSKNLFFVLSMNTLSSNLSVKFHNVKKKDAENILNELFPFFVKKETPVLWFNDVKFTSSQRNSLFPGILTTHYDKSLNKCFPHKLKAEDFATMLVEYLDGFLLKGTAASEDIAANVRKFNPSFVNQHLKSLNTELPKLLSLLEDRPEYYVIVAINTLPEVSGTVLHRLRHLFKMKFRDVAKMSLRDFVSLNFETQYNLTEEQYIYLNKNINWEICFKGLYKLVRNVYWVSKCRPNDVFASHISEMITYTFNQLRKLYSFHPILMTSESDLRYCYLLEPSFFYILQENEDFFFNNSMSKNGEHNFITSLLKHIRYEMGNDDGVIFEIIESWVNTIKSNDYSWDPQLFIEPSYQNVVMPMASVKKPTQKAIEKYPYIIKALKDLENIKDYKSGLLYAFILNFKYIFEEVGAPSKKVKSLMNADAYLNISNFLLSSDSSSDNRDKSNQAESVASALVSRQMINNKSTEILNNSAFDDDNQVESESFKL